MKSFTPTTTPGNTKALLASLLTCIMLAAPLTPLGFASTTSRLVQAKGVAKQQPAPRDAAPAKSAALPQKEQPAAPLAVGPITATKTDSRTAAQPVGPTDTINYTITITNTGSDAATGVVLNDVIDANTTLVPASILSTPVANPDTYNVIGNVIIRPDAAQGVLANDSNPDNGDNTGITASGPASSGQGGNVTVNSDGSFSYNPAPGFTGTDTFTYTVTTTATGKTDTGTVTLLVGNGTATPGDRVIWFINNSNTAAGRDGRITHPFNNIAEFNTFAPDQVGDIIFVYTGNGSPYVGPVVLLNNQQLIGQGVDLTTASGFTVPPYSEPLPGAGAAPVINSAAAAGSDTVTLNSTGAGGANTIRGVTLGNATDSDIDGANFGTLTVSDTTLNGTGRALNLSTGTLAATFLGITSTSSPAQGVSLTAIGGSLTSTGGTTISGSTAQCVLVSGSSLAASFGNTSCTGGTDGISLQNNTNANTRTFGTLNVSGGSGNAFLHSVGGNTTVTGTASLASALNPVEILNSANGTSISFAAATVTKTTAGGAGVNWGGTNTGATLGFASLGITTSNGSGLVAAGGGTINVTTGTIGATGSAGQAAPAINANAVALNATFSSVSSLNSGNSGNGILLTNVTGSLTMNAGSISGAAGDAFRVNGQNANITYNGTISTAAARPVNIDNKTGGTVSFGGVPSSGTAMISSTSNGVLLNSNTGATINFSGGLSLSTGANDAFAATAGGTVNVTQNNTGIVNTLTTTTGTALRVVNTTIGASRLTFRSINSTANGSNNGVILDNTGTSGGLTVSGNGGTCTSAANCTGGTIANKTGANGSTTQGTGIYLNNTSGVSLDRMQLNDFQNYAIFGSSVTGFSLTNSNISGANGNNNTAPVEEGSIRFNNLLTSGTFPTAQISNNAIGGGGTFNVFVVNNTSGSALNRLVMSNNAFGLISSTIGNDNVAVIARPIAPNTATVNVSLLSNTFSGTRSDFFETIADGNSTVDVIARQNKFTNGQAIIPGGGVGVSLRGDVAGTASNMTFDVSCNRVVGGHDTVGMFVAKGNGGGTWSGAIVNNVIGPAVAGANADGIFARAAGSGTISLLIQNNAITGFGNAGLHLQNNDGSVTMNASIFGNSVTAPLSASSFAALFIDNGGTASDTATMNAVVGSATNAALQNTFSNPGGVIDVSLGNFSATNATKFNLSRNGSAAGTPAGVIQDDNVGTPSVDTSAGNGVITLVNTLPTVPATPATCSVPAIAQDALDEPLAATAPAFAAQPLAPQPTTQQSFVVAPRPGVMLAPQSAAAGQAARAALPGAQKSSDDSRAAQTKSLAAKDGKSKDPVAAPQVANFPVTIGTLGAGKSVTITFSVTVNNPLAASVTQISNQGTVSGSNFSAVQTDDPDVAGTNNPTVTDVIPQPSITINNATVPEPRSGSAPMPFSVVLGSAYTVPVTVNYATASGGGNPATGGANCGDPNADYATTSGVLTFAAGQTVQTVSVEVCTDADTSETDETLLVDLSAAVNGTIVGGGQATGTITVANPAGTIMISELRTSGPGTSGTGDSTDEFVELYNNSDTDVTVPVGGWGLFKMGAACADVPVLVGTVPAGTVIPGRGYFLFTGSGYSLANYGGTGAAAGNQPLASDIEDDRNVGLFSTIIPVSLSTATRLDAVGFAANAANNCDLLREGTNLPGASGSTQQYTFVRNETTGKPLDRNVNATDFLVLSTTAAAVGDNPTPLLGAPGPQNLTSPVNRSATVKPTLVDPLAASTGGQNRVRDLTPDPLNNSTFGTLAIRRKFTNTTGVPVTQLRFRVIDITTCTIAPCVPGMSAPAGVADLRVRTSSTSTINLTGGGTAQVQGLTLETPPAQPMGGGWNSTVAAGTITPGTPLGSGGSINVEFLLGLQQTGTFRFFIIVEALAPGSVTLPGKPAGETNGAKSLRRDNGKDVPQN